MWKSRHLYDSSALGYDVFIRGFVPSLDTMQEKVVEIVRELFGTEGLKRLLELGVGTGALAFRLLSEFRTPTYWGYEASPEMARLAGARLSMFRGNASVARKDFRREQWPMRLDAIVTTLTLHYLSNEDKQKVFRKCFHALRDGGVLVVGDRVVPRGSLIARVYHSRMVKFWDRTTKHWVPELRLAHKTHDDPKEEPWFLEDQLQWLHEAGFGDTECVWKDFNYCVFCAIKADSKRGASR